jgi:hypothetical protein
VSRLPDHCRDHHDHLTRSPATGAVHRHNTKSGLESLAPSSSTAQVTVRERRGGGIRSLLPRSYVRMPSIVAPTIGLRRPPTPAPSTLICPSMGETPHRRLPSKPSGLAWWFALAAARRKGVGVGGGAKVLRCRRCRPREQHKCLFLSYIQIITQATYHILLQYVLEQVAPC